MIIVCLAASGALAAAPKKPTPQNGTQAFHKGTFYLGGGLGLGSKIRRNWAYN